MKMSPITDRDFGRLEAEVEALRDELREHKEESRRAIQAAREQIEGQTRKIDQLLEMANKGRGAWWAALGRTSPAAVRRGPNRRREVRVEHPAVGHRRDRRISGRSAASQITTNLQE